MLDVKKTLAKMLAFIDNNKIRSVIFTGTLNGSGALSLSSVVPLSSDIISIRTATEANALCIPWVYSNYAWYVSVVNWANMSPTAFANRTMTFTIKYVVGGG